MNADGLDPANSAEVWEILDERVFAFEEDCKTGHRKSLDAYLPDASESIRQLVLLELIKVDLELQWKAGSHISLTEYCHRYEVLGPKENLPPDLVYEAYRVACQHGQVDSAEQFCQAFPEQRDAVLALAGRSATLSTAISKQKPQRTFQVGDRYGDFELMALLGAGAFGQVYLARQVSLARQVALKISANRGSEARTMASLDHDHIVKVFSETVDEQANLRLLCMQYVPGTNLGKIISALTAKQATRKSGQEIVETIDALTTTPAIFQAGAMKERELLSAADWTGAVCWIGARLAEALDYAHQQGVLHRDVKPDNILTSQFGRPLLADFNLSLDPHEVGGTAAGMFGGSLAYMSPEHLNAFNPMNETPTSAVDARSDVFSLGIVLFELCTLRRPYRDEVVHQNHVDLLHDLANQRSSPPDTSAAGPLLSVVLNKCFAPNPDQRFQSSIELADSLESTRQLNDLLNALPKPNWFIRKTQRNILLALLVVAVIPNLLASGVNIAYNVLRILPQLSDFQQASFDRILLIYNVVVYPVCVVWLCWLALPFVRAKTDGVSQETLAAIRKRVVMFPTWLVAVSCLGWLPGGLLFPTLLDWNAGGVSPSVYGHFAFDFTISGLIALTYSYFGVELVLLRTLYPTLLIGCPRPKATARRELQNVRLRIRVAQVAAGAIPLVGAILMVAVGPEDVESYGIYRTFLMLLMAGGIFGFYLAIEAGSLLTRVLSSITE